MKHGLRGIARTYWTPEDSQWCRGLGRQDPRVLVSYLYGNPHSELTPAQLGTFKAAWPTPAEMTIRVPQVDLLDEGVVRFCWSSEGRYAEIEMNPDGTGTWFHRDRATDTHFGGSLTEDWAETFKGLLK